MKVPLVFQTTAYYRQATVVVSSETHVDTISIQKTLSTVDKQSAVLQTNNFIMIT